MGFCNGQLFNWCNIAAITSAEGSFAPLSLWFISFAILLLFKLSIFSNFDCFVDDIEVVFVPSPGSLRFHGTWLFYPAACMFLYVYI